MDTGYVLPLLAVVALAGMAWALGWDRHTRWLGYARTSEERAEALLRQILGEEEFWRCMRCGYLDIPSPMIAGRIYRIPFRPGRVEVIEQGKPVAKLCIVPTRRIPAADLVITHKLLIEGDEARYLSVANHFTASGGVWTW